MRLQRTATKKGYTVLVGARDAERGATAVSDLQAFGNAELLLVDC